MPLSSFVFPSCLACWLGIEPLVSSSIDLQSPVIIMLFALADVADAVGALYSPFLPYAPVTMPGTFSGWKRREMHTQERIPNTGSCPTFLTSQKRHALYCLPELAAGGIQLHLSITPVQHTPDWLRSLPCLTSPLSYQCFLGLLPK